MLHHKQTFPITLALLLSLGVAVEPLRSQEDRNLIIAQTTETSFPLPDKLPQGSAVKISGSENVVEISNSLKEKFEEKFSGSTVELSSTDSDSALKAVADKKVDLAAISRPLTSTEEAQGFKPVTINREKIAIIVGENNPYNGNLTIKDFAKIFRGEITNWSEVGGPSAPIKLVDRLVKNDTRRSFPSYPVFQGTQFKTGSNATVPGDSEITGIVKELGNNGISYAPVSVVKGVEGIKVVTMHKTLPDDPRYPFSQPNLYVYQGDLSPAAKGYLGFVTADAGQGIIKKAIASGKSLPGIKLPSVDIPEVNVSIPKVDLKLPSVDIPEVNVGTPKVDVELPSVDTPDVNVEAPKVDVELPSVDTPDINVEAPKVNAELPSVDIPDVNAQLPSVSTPDIVTGKSNWWWYLPLLGLIPIGWFLLNKGKKDQTEESQTFVRERELVGAGVGSSSPNVETDNNAGNNFATGAAIATGLGGAAIANRRRKQSNLPEFPDIKTPDLPNVGGAVDGIKGKLGDITPDIKTPDLPDVGGAVDGIKGKLGDITPDIKTPDLPDVGGAVDGIKGKLGDITPDIKAPDLPNVGGAVDGIKGKLGDITPDIKTPDLPNVGGAVDGIKGKLGDITPDIKAPDLPDVGGAVDGLKGKFGGAVDGIKGKLGDVTPDIKTPDLPNAGGAVDNLKNQAGNTINNVGDRLNLDSIKPNKLFKSVEGKASDVANNVKNEASNIKDNLLND